MRAYLYRVWGYAMTGDTGDQAMFINHGDGMYRAEELARWVDIIFPGGIRLLHR